MNEKRDGIRRQCEREGISWARAGKDTWSDGEIGLYVREWIEEYDLKDRLARERLQDERSAKAVEAAQESARTSSLAAESSRRSATWTMIAAIASAVGALIPLAQTFGWLTRR